MDIILDVCDYLILDKVYATLVPLSAFSASSDAFYSSVASPNSSIPLKIASSSSWSDFVAWSHLPHPQLAPTNLTQLPYADFPAASAWPRDYVPRQLISLTLLTLLGIHVLYFLFAGLSFKYIFNHEMMKHPRFLKNQIRLEIECSMRAFPALTMMMLPLFQAEVMGYSRLYDDVSEYGWGYFFFSIAWFLFFTDFCIYWIHRWLHLPIFYKHIHKPHHKWIVPTPFASHAFHPFDGFMQGVPYHLFIFLFPLHRKLYLALFVGVNMWTILIHDSDMITGHPLENVINGPAHHTLHHLYFTVNYGQYFTWADRAGGSYRHPAKELDPLLEVQAAAAAKTK